MAQNCTTSNYHFHKSGIAILVFKIQGCFGTAQYVGVIFDHLGNKKNFPPQISQNPVQIKLILFDFLCHN